MLPTSKQQSDGTEIDEPAGNLQAIDYSVINPGLAPIESACQ